MPIIRNGETVAVMLTPEALEQIEDEGDAALIRAARAEAADEPRVTLEELAARHGIDVFH